MLMKKTYWYKFIWKSCPVCGREQNYKERQYTEKPKEYETRHIYEELYDAGLQ